MLLPGCRPPVTEPLEQVDLELQHRRLVVVGLDPLARLAFGEPLVGRLLTYDSLTEDFRTLRLRRDPQCPACGDESMLPKLVEYDDACRPAGSVARVS